jgi:hypothetical protein
MDDMNDLDDIIRRNPKAAESLDAIKEVLATMEKLRKAGIAHGPKPLMPPHSGRYSEIQRPTRKVTPATKISF